MVLTQSTQTLICATVLTLATSSQGIFTTASKVDGRYLYNFATVPFLAEILKLLVSTAFLRKAIATSETPVKMTRAWRTWVLFPVPSLIYVVHNNVQFYMLKYVNPSTYQILGNLKIITTGLLFRIFLGRRLSALQWIALVLLMVGATTSQIKTDCEDGMGSALAAPIEGYLFGLLSAFLSAMAAVYTEWIMKKNDDSLYWQNIQLYSFGVLFNFLKLTIDDINSEFREGFWINNIFNGYNVATYLVVCNLAFTGLLVSWIMKFADSIVKVYSTSMAMLVTMILSVWLFDLQPTVQLVLGICCASSSLQLYYMKPTDLVIAVHNKVGTRLAAMLKETEAEDSPRRANTSTSLLLERTAHQLSLDRTVSANLRSVVVDSSKPASSRDMANPASRD